jgi:predicted lipoprotein with Yx(FWY)xxD motif
MSTNRTSDRIHRRRGQIAAITLAAAALTLTAASCSNDSGSSTAAGSGPVPSATGSTVSAQPTALGTILVDGQGRTVYVFANDTNTTSTCTASCATEWPPVPAPASLPQSLPGVTGALGTTTRADGNRQLTVAGHPVYTFAGDSAAGQTNGQGVNLNGGVWNVVSPAGAAVTSSSSAGAIAPGY